MYFVFAPSFKKRTFLMNFNSMDSISISMTQQSSYLKLHVNSLTTFKTLISQKVHIPEKYSRLVWNGKTLHNDRDYISIPTNAFIEVLMTLEGGKKGEKRKVFFTVFLLICRERKTKIKVVAV